MKYYILFGPPGAGKSMMSKRLPGILPDMTREEILQSTEIYSVAGLTGKHTPIIATRPFRSPHHTMSTAGLAGGGKNPKPGEISLAHHGVLFLDEFPEFDKSATEVLRQPLEDGHVGVSRAAAAYDYPSKFMLVAAMNPCPCGNFGNPLKKCVCSPKTVASYINRISGPLLDRIDLQAELPQVKLSDINQAKKAEPSEKIRERVNAAREIQRKRFKGTDISCNAKMTPEALKECAISDAARELLDDVFEKRSLSMRAYDKLIKISRTAADLEGSADIMPRHINEAVYFRSLDKKYWNREG